MTPIWDDISPYENHPLEACQDHVSLNKLQNASNCAKNKRCSIMFNSYSSSGQKEAKRIQLGPTPWYFFASCGLQPSSDIRTSHPSFHAIQQPKKNEFSILDGNWIAFNGVESSLFFNHQFLIVESMLLMVKSPFLIATTSLLTAKSSFSIAIPRIWWLNHIESTFFHHFMNGWLICSTFLMVESCKIPMLQPFFLLGERPLAASLGRWHLCLQSRCDGLFQVFHA